MESETTLKSLLDGIPREQIQAALIGLCEEGLITCTSGRPGDKNATYALAWLPLNDPERYPPEIRARHEQNIRRLGVLHD
jgi:hypothetical protein